MQSFKIQEKRWITDLELIDNSTEGKVNQHKVHNCTTACNKKEHIFWSVSGGKERYQAYSWEEAKC
jgi:hypothetical protein